MGSPPSPTHLPILIPMLHLLLRIDGGSSAHPLGQTPLLFILPLLPGVDGGGGGGGGISHHSHASNPPAAFPPSARLYSPAALPPWGGEGHPW